MYELFLFSKTSVYEAARIPQDHLSLKKEGCHEHDLRAPALPSTPIFLKP